MILPRLSGPNDGTVGGPSVAARRVKNSMLQAQSHVLKLGNYVVYIMGKSIYVGVYVGVYIYIFIFIFKVGNYMMFNLIGWRELGIH